MKKIKITERQVNLLKSLSVKKVYKVTKEQDTRIKKLIKEDIGSSELHQAVGKLIHDIYNTPSQAGLGDFWVRNGITWADINSYLTALGLIVATGSGTYQLAKKFKNRFFSKPIEAADAVEDSLKVLVQKKGNYLREPEQAMSREPKLETEGSGFDRLYADDPNDERDAFVPEPVGPRTYKATAMNHELAILKDDSGSLYVFYYDELPEDAFGTVRDIELSDIDNYVNNNIKKIELGFGLEDFNSGKMLVKIDEPLKNELTSLYDKSPDIISILSQISEVTSAGSASSGGSSGPFVGPMTSSIIKKTPVVEGKLKKFKISTHNINEGPVAGSSATGGSTGAYDANALPGISGDGSFKKPKKSRAEVDTQYPSGSFVEIDDCTKLNNNKQAQNGKCSTGAVDNVVKVKKGKGSIISKSALLESVINELGLGDWKVKAIIEKLEKIELDPIEFPKFYNMVTGDDVNKTRFPKEKLIIALREMGKEDIDHLYDKLFFNV